MVSEDREYQLEAKGFQLVGEFMSNWAALEAEIDEGLGRISRMGPLVSLALRTQLSFRDKVDLFQHLTSNYTQNDTEKEIVKSFLKSIRNLSSTRNTIVHSVFWMDDNSSIIFSKSKMNEGNLKFQELTITESEFDDIFDTITQLIENVRSATDSAVRRRDETERESDFLVSFTLPVKEVNDAEKSGLGALFQLLTKSE
jgi:hypothetical protein